MTPEDWIEENNKRIHNLCYATNKSMQWMKEGVILAGSIAFMALLASIFAVWVSVSK